MDKGIGRGIEDKGGNGVGGDISVIGEA